MMMTKSEVYDMVKNEIGVGPSQSYKSFIGILTSYVEVCQRRYREKQKALKGRKYYSTGCGSNAVRDVEIYEKYIQIWRDYEYVPLDVYERATDLVYNYIENNLK